MPSIHTEMPSIHIEILSSLLHSLLHSGVEKITLDFKDIIGNTDELIEEITEMAFGDAR